MSEDHIVTNSLSGERDHAQPEHSIHQHLARLAASTLVAVSAGLGAYAGWQFGSYGGIVLAVGLAVAAVAGEILKPYAVANTLDAASRLEPGRLLASFAVAMVCIGYSVAGHVYLAAMARTDMTAQRTAESRSVGDTRQERERVLAELKSIGSPRTQAELKPLMASATKLGGNCAKIETATQREACKALPNFQAEAARHDRKVAAEAALATADRKIAAAGPTAEKVSDPLAAALIVYLSALGHHVTAEQAGPILALIPMALLEICSMFAVVATRRRQPDQDPMVTGKDAKLSTLSARAEPKQALPAPTVEPINQPSASVRGAADRIVALAKERGGTLQATSKREVARLIDASPPTASRALTALAGIAAVTVDESGVVVTLLA